jgi:hypothetical protein
MEAIRWIAWHTLAPERIHHLLAMEAMAGGERQELDERTRALEPPDILVKSRAADHHREAAQQANLHLQWIARLRLGSHMVTSTALHCA